MNLMLKGSMGEIELYHPEKCFAGRCFAKTKSVGWIW